MPAATRTPRPLATLRHDMRPVDWLAERALETDACDRSTWEPGLLQVVENPRHDMLAARGRIPEHVDADFPPWSYLLVLRAPPGATLIVRGHEPLELAPGMLVEFNSHTRHRLVQKPREDTIWCPIDSDDRLDLDEAYVRMALTFG